MFNSISEFSIKKSGRRRTSSSTPFFDEVHFCTCVSIAFRRGKKKKANKEVATKIVSGMDYLSNLSIDTNILILAGSSNGRTSPSGGEYLGSSPSPAATKFLNISLILKNCVFAEYEDSNLSKGSGNVGVSRGGKQRSVRNRGFLKRSD